MQWILGLLVVAIFAGLAWLFTAFALEIRRDFKERFERIGRRLSHDAEAIVRNLPP